MMQTTEQHTGSEISSIKKLLDAVPDPEVPVLSVNDLGIVRSIEIMVPQKRVTIAVTPTYSGCPAMDTIRMQIRMALLQAGYEQVTIIPVLSPAWTTDWLSEEGKQKLKAYGIAPPGRSQPYDRGLFENETVPQCPQCQSFHTVLISEFGSTACKSLYRCEDCGEPFDHFKCH